MFFVDFFRYGYQSIVYCKILKKIYKDEKLPERLSQLLKFPIQMDKIGRLYTVLNPFLLENDGSTPPYEYDIYGNRQIPVAYIEKWIMDRLNIANSYILAQNIFDLVTYTLRPVSINDIYKNNINLDISRIRENFLFIIEPLPYKPFFKAFKKMMWFLFILIICTIVILLLF